MKKEIVLLVVVLIYSSLGYALTGQGTEENPYLIKSLADFDEFAGDYGYWVAGVHTKLMTDINLAGRTYNYAVIAPDISLSGGFDGSVFEGVFDGNNSRITHLTIDTSGVDYRVLTEVGMNENPHFSPDGKHIIFSSNRLGPKDIFTMDITGRNQRRLTRSGKCTNPNWGPLK